MSAVRAWLVPSVASPGSYEVHMAQWQKSEGADDHGVVSFGPEHIALLRSRDTRACDVTGESLRACFDGFPQDPDSPHNWTSLVRAIMDLGAAASAPVEP